MLQQGPERTLSRQKGWTVDGRPLCSMMIRLFQECSFPPESRPRTCNSWGADLFTQSRGLLEKSFSKTTFGGIWWKESTIWVNGKVGKDGNDDDEELRRICTAAAHIMMLVESGL